MILFFADILLHQSGHIMLSDFDLAKQASEKGRRAAGMQIGSHGVSHIMDWIARDLTFFLPLPLPLSVIVRFPWWIPGHARRTSEQIRL